MSRPAVLAALAVAASVVWGLAAFTSCATPRGGASATESADLAAERAENADEEDDPTTIADALPHPAKPTAWHTRTLVTTAEQPAAKDIYTCLESFRAIATEAGNSQDMAAAAVTARAFVTKAPALAHWCFYQAAVQLDDRLAGPGELMSAKADVFFSTMRLEWILARALDEVVGGETYFDYVRARYVQISADVFGRDVQVLGPPTAPFALPQDPAGAE